MNGRHRILNVHRNVPGVLRDINKIVSDWNANIQSQVLATDSNIGYLVMDLDQAGMMHAFLAGVDLSENGQALDAIREVGPGKHFLGCAHTQANFETAFFRSSLADNNSVEQWESEGGQDMAQRANTLWKKMLREYEPPPIDPAVDEALLDFMARRKASFPDSNV